MFENDAPFESFSPAEETAAGTELNPMLEQFTPEQIESAELDFTPLETYEMEEQQEALASPTVDDTSLPLEQATQSQEESIQLENEGALHSEELSLPPEQAEQPQEEGIQMENETALHTEEVSEQSANQFDEVLTEE